VIDALEEIFDRYDCDKDGRLDEIESVLCSVGTENALPRFDEGPYSKRDSNSGGNGVISGTKEWFVNSWKSKFSSYGTRGFVSFLSSSQR